jgi:hypothetical protein
MLNSHINLLIELQIAEIAKLQRVLNDDPHYFPPTIPNECFLNLPAPIAEAVNQYETLEERSIALLSTVVVAGSGLNEIIIPYRKKHYNTNLYLVIIGPPASNKGIALHSRKILEKITERYELTYKRDYAIYEAARKQNKINAKSNYSAGQENLQSEPSGINYSNLELNEIEPNPKYAILPADISAAALINLADKNDGAGLIFDSEAQTLLNSFKQDWGANLTSLLLKSFENEPIEVARMTLTTMLSIPKPRLSVLLTGNPEHLSGLVKSITNGMFSRFGIYQTRKVNWVDIKFEENSKDYLEGYANLATIIDQINSDLETGLKVTFRLTDVQIHFFNKFFGKLDTRLSFEIDNNFASVVRRMGVIFWRMCAVLTALRNHENLNSELVCADADFQNGIYICSTLLKHSLYSYLTTADVNQPIDEFISELPEEFSRQQALVVAKKLNISDRRMDNYLKDSSGPNGKILKVKHGEYKKKAPAILQNMQYEEPTNSNELSKEADVNENSAVHNLELPNHMVKGSHNVENDSRGDFLAEFMKSTEPENTYTANEPQMSKMDKDVRFVLSDYPFDFDEEFEAAVYSIFKEDLILYSRYPNLILDEFIMGLQSVYMLSDKGIKHIIAKLIELNILSIKEDGCIAIRC